MAKAEVAQGFHRRIFIVLAKPDASQGMFTRFRVGENFFKMTADLPPMFVQDAHQGLPVGKVHAAGKAGAGIIIFGQRMGLLVFNVLQAMFDTTQENIGFAQLSLGLARYQFALGQQFEYGERWSNLQ